MGKSVDYDGLRIVCSFCAGIQGMKQKFVGEALEATILEAGEGRDFILRLILMNRAVRMRCRWIRPRIMSSEWLSNQLL
jgi:hypothetical protein